MRKNHNLNWSARFQISSINMFFLDHVWFLPVLLVTLFLWRESTLLESKTRLGKPTIHFCLLCHELSLPRLEFSQRRHDLNNKTPSVSSVAFVQKSPKIRVVLPFVVCCWLEKTPRQQLFCGFPMWIEHTFSWNKVMVSSSNYQELFLSSTKMRKKSLGFPSHFAVFLKLCYRFLGQTWPWNLLALLIEPVSQTTGRPSEHIYCASCCLRFGKSGFEGFMMSRTLVSNTLKWCSPDPDAWDPSPVLPRCPRSNRIFSLQNETWQKLTPRKAVKNMCSV